MNERDKIRKALKEQYPEIEWPEVRVEVPEDYWQEAKNQAMHSLDNPNNRRGNQGVVISLISLAAAMLFLLLLWNPFQTTESEPLSNIGDEELEQFLQLESYDFNEGDWVFLFNSENKLGASPADIVLSEEDWDIIIEEWPYELNESTIYELQNQIQ